ncbi:MAG: CHAT domain-containing protein [Bryobacteraceae bacterium]
MVLLAALLLPLTAAAIPAAERGGACPPDCAPKRLAQEASRALAEGRFQEAERWFLLAAEQAREAGDLPRAAKLFSNAGAARIYQHKYREAFDALSQAQGTARAGGLVEVEAGIWSNLASLYGILGAWQEAERSLEKAVILMPASSPYRPAVLAQRVRQALQRERRDEVRARQLWIEAMAEAEKAGDWQTQRHLWDDLAEWRLGNGDLAQAEAALANSFRLITLHHLRDPSPFWLLLGRLRLAQGSPREALACLRRIPASGAPGSGGVNNLTLAAAEAQAQSRLNGPAAVLETCRQHWENVFHWRTAVLPDPGAEAAADVMLAELVDQYVGAALALARSAPSLAVEAWASVEQSRALGIIRMRSGRRQGAGTGGNAESGLQSSRLSPATLRHASLMQPAQPVSPQNLLRAIQASLRPNQTAFTFWLGAERPAAWAVTRTSFAWASLGDRDGLVRRLRQFREAVAAGNDPGREAGKLFAELFGQFPQAFLANEEWLISADDVLLVVPVGALRMGSGAEARYLSEAHTVTILPSGLWLLEQQFPSPPRRLLAVGGLVHNTADPRWLAGRTKPTGWNTAWSRLWRRGGEQRETGELELASLPGSGRELGAVAALWQARGLHVQLLSGFDATRDALQTYLRDDWTDLHFATHVLPAPGEQAYRTRISAQPEGPLRILFPVGEPYLALSLRRDGVREGLTAASLMSLPQPAARVVLNGCSTGLGPSQTGAGIRSFATAWLAAGAQTVIASLWPVDDDGEFFTEYYRNLLTGARASAALHAAQTAMIRSGTWRAQPRYWAAYFHLGKD